MSSSRDQLSWTLIARKAVGSYRSEVLASPGLVVFLLLPPITALMGAEPSARHVGF